MTVFPGPSKLAYSTTTTTTRTRRADLQLRLYIHAERDASMSLLADQSNAIASLSLNSQARQRPPRTPGVRGPGHCHHNHNHNLTIINQRVSSQSPRRDTVITGTISRPSRIPSLPQIRSAPRQASAFAFLSFVSTIFDSVHPGDDRSLECYVRCSNWWREGGESSRLAPLVPTAFLSSHVPHTPRDPS